MLYKRFFSGTAREAEGAQEAGWQLVSESEYAFKRDPTDWARNLGIIGRPVTDGFALRAVVLCTGHGFWIQPVR